MLYSVKQLMDIVTNINRLNAVVGSGILDFQFGDEPRVQVSSPEYLQKLFGEEPEVEYKEKYAFPYEHYITVGGVRFFAIEREARDD